MSGTREIEIGAARGRPMLTWVGKRPLRRVTAFPAQPVESFLRGEGADPAREEGWTEWPPRYPRGGLIFHGDNSDVLAHLLANGFRGRVDLVYIDPPFDSGADYVRKVALRGVGGAVPAGGERYSLGEQIQYADIWANDNYLQFMYERLLLLKELLAEEGSIVLHCDWHRSHQLRCLMDEVFGPDNLQNEIVWQRTDPHNDAKSRLGWVHDTLFWYRKGERATYNWREVVEPLSEAALREYSLLRLPDGETVPYTPELEGTPGRRFKLDDCTWKGRDPARQFEWRGARPSDKRVWPYDEEGMEAALARGELYLRNPERGAARCRVSFLDEREGQVLQTIWTECGRMKGGSDYPTQKPRALLARIVQAFSNPGDLVLDCFAGSGTTALAAQQLGRRWIACDINRGAIQTMSKRLRAAIEAQAAGEAPAAAQLGFTVWRVNDYDLRVHHEEAVRLACEHVGIERTRADRYFDGTLGRRLVKIVPFGRPLAPADLEALRRELEARPEEARGVTFVCLGIELAARSRVEAWNRTRSRGAAGHVEVIELRTDPRYGRFIAHEPASARVSVARADGTIRVRIEDFVSPSIVQRLDLDAALVRARIPDWRSMVDCVLIDPRFDGEVFEVALADVPEGRDDLVRGEYALPTGEGETTVAVKVIDMLGEEVVVTATV